MYFGYSSYYRAKDVFWAVQKLYNYHLYQLTSCTLTKFNVIPSARKTKTWNSSGRLIPIYQSTWRHSPRISHNVRVMKN
jgi:hypothetical protein